MVRPYGLLAALLLLALVAAPAVSAARAGLTPASLGQLPTWEWYGMVYALPGGVPVPGAQVSLWSASSDLACQPGVFLDSVTADSSGYFALQTTQPSDPGYVLILTPPPGYAAAGSVGDGSPCSATEVGFFGIDGAFTWDGVEFNVALLPPTATAAPAAADTATALPTETPAWTATPPPEVSPTPAATDTLTPTITATSSPSPSPSATPPATLTASPAAKASPTARPLGTASPSATRGLTPVPRTVTATAPLAAAGAPTPTAGFTATQALAVVSPSATHADVTATPGETPPPFALAPATLAPAAAKSVPAPRPATPAVTVGPRVVISEVNYAGAASPLRQAGLGRSAVRVPGLARPAASALRAPPASAQHPRPVSVTDPTPYQWVELVNVGAERASVAGWRLETNAGATVLPDLILAPGAAALIAADPAGLRAQYPLLRALVVAGLAGGLSPIADRLVLRDAAGARVDEMAYGTGGSQGVSEPGRSLARLNLPPAGALPSGGSGAEPDGVAASHFVERIVPGPGGLEAPASLLAAARRNPPREETRDLFFASIPTPLEFLGTPLHELASDFLLALILALIFGAFTTMLNDVVKQEENTLAGLFGSVPVVGPALAALSGRLGALRPQRTVAALAKLGIMFLVYALLFSGLDPGWRPLGPGGAFLFLTMLGTVALLSTVDGIVQWRMVRRWGVPHDFRFWPFNVVVAALSLGASRLFVLRPGLIFGAPGGLDYDAGAVDARRQARLFWAGLATIIGLGAMAWLASYAFNVGALAADRGGQAVAGWPRVFAGARNFALLLFVCALQTVFFEMLPLAGTYGQQVWRRSRVAWAALMVGAAFVMARVMFNPYGDFVAAFSDRPAQFLVLFVALVSAFCIGGWAFLRWRRRVMEQGVT